jgi:hypothetical protein
MPGLDSATQLCNQDSGRRATLPGLKGVTKVPPRTAWSRSSAYQKANRWGCSLSPGRRDSFRTVTRCGVKTRDLTHRADGVLKPINVRRPKEGQVACSPMRATRWSRVNEFWNARRPLSAMRRRSVSFSNR